MRKIAWTQRLVLAFFAFAWVSLLLILVVAPDVYDQSLKLGEGSHRLADLAFLIALSAFLLLLSVGVIRRWRWIFWLILLAFLAGVLRVPVAILELSGLIPLQGPAWYVLFQAIIGVVQFAIGLTLLAGNRRGGPWSD